MHERVGRRRRMMLAGTAILTLAPCAGLLDISDASAHEETPATTARLVGPVLNVVGIDKELGFYENILGLELGMTLDHGSRREYMMRFSDDPGEAGLILVHDSAADAPSQLSHGNAFQRVILRVSDMDTLLARISAAGIPHRQVMKAQGGIRTLSLKDPEGYSLEIVSGDH